MEEAKARPMFVSAIQMKNFIYILVDRTKNIGVAVDACWDVDGIYKHAKDVIGVNLIGSIYTHFSFRPCREFKNTWIERYIIKRWNNMDWRKRL